MKATAKYVDDSDKTIDIDIYYHISWHEPDTNEEREPVIIVDKITEHDNQVNLIVMGDGHTESLQDICWKHFNSVANKVAK